MTIFALSSGPGISGVSILRVSGKETKNVIYALTQKEIPKPRFATLRKFNKILASTTDNNGILQDIYTDGIPCNN